MPGKGIQFNDNYYSRTGWRQSTSGWNTEGEMNSAMAQAYPAQGGVRTRSRVHRGRLRPICRSSIVRWRRQSSERGNRTITLRLATEQAKNQEFAPKIHGRTRRGLAAMTQAVAFAIGLGLGLGARAASARFNGGGRCAARRLRSPDLTDYRKAALL